MHTVRLTALTSILFLCAGCSLWRSSDSQEERSHEIRALSGYFPALGPAIDAEVIGGHATEVKLPTRVTVSQLSDKSALRLSKRGEKLFVRAGDQLPEDGAQFTVRTIDAKEYRFRALPAADGATKTNITVQNHGTKIVPIKDEAKARFGSGGVDASNASPKDATILLKALKGAQGAGGPVRVVELEDRLYRDTPQFGALINSAYRMGDMVGYALKIANRIDAPLRLRHEEFLSKNSLLVEIKDPIVPAKAPGYHTGAQAAAHSIVYVVERITPKSLAAVVLAQPRRGAW